jgi:hypothetical protein
MRDRERDQWGEVRKKGMTTFVLFNGVMLWGVPMFVVMTFVLQPNRLPLILSVAVWLSTGALYGLVLWLVQERRYQKALGKNRQRHAIRTTEG